MKIIILCLSLVFLLMFSNASYLDASELQDNVENNTSNNIEEIDSDDTKNDISNSSADDMFGDEQTFPFVAGLGKNAAH